jgi:pimeloyl-ACP methyl ester carboxylesterase
LIRAEQGLPFSPPIIDKLAGALPRAERKIFSGADHEPEQSQPEDYAAAIIEFVTSSTLNRDLLDAGPQPARAK